MDDGHAMRETLPAEPTHRLALVHLADEGRANTLAAAIRTEGFGVAVIEVSKSVVEIVVSRDDEAMLVAYRFGTFDLARFCLDVRTSTDCPIIVLTSGGSIDPDAADDVVVDALRAGADEVLSDRTPPRVLGAQIRATIRDHPRSARKPIRIGDVAIDPDGYVVTIGPRVQRVRPILFQLLLVLARHAGAILGPDQLLAEVWGESGGSVDTRRIRIAVSRLRHTLGEGPLRPVIETVPHVGYRLIVPGA